MTGISLGGHFAPRAVAFEPRFASGAVWGANHNWAEVQQQAAGARGREPGAALLEPRDVGVRRASMEDFLAKAADMHLNGVMERIRVPFLVTHGEKDRQIALAMRTRPTSNWSTRRGAS